MYAYSATLSIPFILKICIRPCCHVGILASRDHEKVHRLEVHGSVSGSHVLAEDSLLPIAAVCLHGLKAL